MLLQNQVIFAAALFFFKEGNPGGAEHQHFPVQAKRTHAESVIFEYGKQTCSGSPLYICFVQINYVKATNRSTLLELPGFVFGADAAAPCSSLIQSSAGPRPLSRNGRCLCPSQPLGGTAVSRSGNSFRTMVFLTRQDNPRLTPYRKQEPGR
mgnify:FL=1